MLTYDICLALKQAGFKQCSQTHLKSEFAYDFANGKYDPKDSTLEADDETKCYQPTLSELIAATPKGFSIHCHKLSPSFGLTYQPTPNSKKQLFGPYSSPEEAVARLYLALKK